MTTPLEEATQTAQTTMQTGGAQSVQIVLLGGSDMPPTSDIQDTRQ
jgi:hypothetical protein